MPQQRLQKYLAICGVASRRAAEELIRSGHVSVNGEPVREMGVLVDPDYDEVSVDGRIVKDVERHVYYALHKPTGVLSSVSDDRGRPTVIDLLQGIEQRVYPVGRLDYDSEGLLLLTNDGELAARLMHPRHSVGKIYRVVVKPRPTPQQIQQLAKGVELDDGPTLPARVEYKGLRPEGVELEFELREGRNRQIRRMCATMGLRVVRLVRMKIGPLSLGSLPAGQWRSLTEHEVDQLRKSAGL
jgi:pseudouridine synthase